MHYYCDKFNGYSYRKTFKYNEFLIIFLLLQDIQYEMTFAHTFIRLYIINLFGYVNNFQGSNAL